MQCFKVRRILLDHLAPRQEAMFSAGIRMQHEELFSRMGTFFFGIFYLQHKINGMLDLFISSPGGREEMKTPASAMARAPGYFVSLTRLQLYALLLLAQVSFGAQSGDFKNSPRSHRVHRGTWCRLAL